MQFTEKSKNILDNCRFCWMCRHLCPVGNATGQERNTARARAMTLSLVVRGGAELTDDIIDNIYECSLCGGCTNNCVTGFDPIVFTKEARRELAMEGRLPAYANKLLDNVDAAGNIYGETDYCSCLKEKIAALPKEADTVLFLGKDARYKAPKQACQAIELLTRAGVKFTVLADEPDSGYAYDFLVSATAETKEIMEKAAKVLAGKTVIAYDPADAKVFLREYKEWGIEPAFRAVTFTSFLADLIEKGALKVKNSGKSLTYNDPALLARDLDEIDPARKIIDACGEAREMLLNKKETMLAGNLIMNEYIPHVMEGVAIERWKNARAIGAETVVTACVADYVMLTKTKTDIDVKTIEEVVLACLSD